jgi:hypothetical protein
MNKPCLPDGTLHSADLVSLLTRSPCHRLWKQQSAPSIDRRVKSRCFPLTEGRRCEASKWTSHTNRCSCGLQPFCYFCVFQKISACNSISSSFFDPPETLPCGSFNIWKSAPFRDMTTPFEGMQGCDSTSIKLTLEVKVDFIGFNSKLVRNHPEKSFCGPVLPYCARS